MTVTRHLDIHLKESNDSSLMYHRQFDHDEAGVVFSFAMVHFCHSLQYLLCGSFHMDTKSVVGSLESKGNRNGTKVALAAMRSKKHRSHHYSTVPLLLVGPLGSD